jgi:ribosomal protein S18 acetylase RimI-like enzyme
MEDRTALTPTSSELEERRKKAQTAHDAFFAGKPEGPLPRSVWLGDGYICAMVFNKRLHLDGVFVNIEVRRTGLGSQYLKLLLEAADMHGAEVECAVRPFGLQDPQTKMGVISLKAWYKRHGFKPVPGKKDYMLRAPLKCDGEHKGNPDHG